jgi:hypothetical protein
MDMDLRRLSGLAGLAVAVVLVAAGCGRHAAAPNAATPGPVGSGASTSGGASTTFTGVTYTDNTVIIDDAAVHSGLKRHDKTSFTFAAGTPGVASLHAGSVAIIAGVAVVKVTDVRSQAGDTVVTTTPANLNDAVKTGAIGWSRPIGWNTLPRSSYQNAAFAAGLKVQTVEVGLRTSPTEMTFKGEVAGFEVSLTLDPQSDGKLNFEVEAERKNNIKVSGKGWLSSFVFDAGLNDNPGTGKLFESHVAGLKGEADLEWHAVSLGSADDSDTPHFELPFSLPIPIEVGPIPFVLTIRSDMRFAPAFTGEASSGGSVHTTFDSDFGFSFDKATPGPVAKLRNVVAALGKGDTVTAGFVPVGFGWGWEFPRLELGLPGTGTFAFISFDTYMSGEFTPGTTLTADVPPCQRAEVILHAIAGYKLALLGFTASTNQTTLWEKKFPFYKDNKPCTL